MVARKMQLMNSTKVCAARDGLPRISRLMSGLGKSNLLEGNMKQDVHSWWTFFLPPPFSVVRGLFCNVSCGCFFPRMEKPTGARDKKRDELELCSRLWVEWDQAVLWTPRHSVPICMTIMLEPVQFLSQINPRNVMLHTSNDKNPPFDELICPLWEWKSGRGRPWFKHFEWSTIWGARLCLPKWAARSRKNRRWIPMRLPRASWKPN